MNDFKVDLAKYISENEPKDVRVMPPRYDEIRLMERALKELSASPWLPMNTAPKGGGAELVSDVNWVDPPKILLLFNDDNAVSVGYWDWYYAEGGRGYSGGLAWIEPISGERLDLNYDGPIGWQPIAEIPA